MRHFQTNLVQHAAPFYRAMTDEQCQQIHFASLEVLQRTGIVIDYPPALELLQRADCAIDGNRVRIPPGRVEWALRSAPSYILVYDRHGRPSMPIGGRISVCGTGSDCLNVLDHRTGEKRPSTLQDVVDGARMGEALPNVDFLMSMFLPNDVPAAKEVKQMEAMLLHSTKPICFVTYEWEGTAENIEMAEIAMGGAQAHRINPTTIIYINVTSAFRHNAGSLRKLMYCAEKHVPAVYVPDVQRGLTCPITFAGAMACMNAGQLVGLVLSQLVSEGAPIILNTAMPTTLDMKTMTTPYLMLSNGNFLELNHYYHLPAFNYGGASDSKVLDEQAILEATFTLYTAMLSGGNMVHDMGYLESGLTGSLELLTICDEVVSLIKAATQPIVIDEETLALELIHEHALSGDFLGTEHTLSHVREDWHPRLIDLQNFTAWMAKGGTTMRERARARVEEILTDEPRPVLPAEVATRIKAVADKAMSNATPD